MIRAVRHREADWDDVASRAGEHDIDRSVGRLSLLDPVNLTKLVQDKLVGAVWRDGVDQFDQSRIAKQDRCDVRAADVLDQRAGQVCRVAGVGRCDVCNQRRVDICRNGRNHPGGSENDGDGSAHTGTLTAILTPWLVVMLTLYVGVVDCTFVICNAAKYGENRCCINAT